MKRGRRCTSTDDDDDDAIFPLFLACPDEWEVDAITLTLDHIIRNKAMQETDGLLTRRREGAKSFY